MDHLPVVLGELGDAPHAREPAPAPALSPAARLSCHADASVGSELVPPVCREPSPEILYRDDALCAYAKPAGLLVHRTRLDRWETDFALQRVRDLLGAPVYPVHRLDKATSGVLLFARSPAVAARLAAAFEAGMVRKRYLAIVRGWPPAELLIEHPLARLADAYEERSASAEPQAARTRLARIATAELPVSVDRYPTSRYALVALEPLSGRRHQLRRHLKHANHPIIGDTTYGQGRHNRLFRERFLTARLMLAAVSLALEHPVTGVPLAIHAPPAADFARVALALGWPAALVAAAGRVEP